MVTVKFLSDVRGARSFPVPSGRPVRFDSGANKVRKDILSGDAAFLVDRYPQAFEIVKAGK